jgi:hypothetical protein
MGKIGIKYPVWLILAVYAIVLLNMQQWRRTAYVGDALGYYLYLPGTLIYGDLDSFDKTTPVWRGYVGAAPVDVRQNSVIKTATGRYSLIYPPGVALLQLPFFLLAHGYCSLSGHFPADGFSPPYMLLSAFSTLFYLLLGFGALVKALRHYFDERVTVYVLLTLAFATHLFFFGAYRPGMAHPYLFALFCGLLWTTVRWYEAPSTALSLLLGALVGGIAMCRLLDVAGAVLLPVAWGGWTGAKKALLRRHFVQIGMAIGAALLVFLPQLLYWKWSSGQWLYYSYVGMGFTWLEPHLKGGFFSYRNGWLVYTPVMALALIGLFFLKKRISAAFLPVIAVFLLHSYIIYSWWCWYYLNGLGSRPMIDIYPILALPLGAFFAWSLRNRWGTVLTIFFLCACTWINFVQTWQTHEGILLSESTKKHYFWSIFGKTRATRQTLTTFHTNLPQPDSSQLTFVKNICRQGMEDSTETAFQSQIKREGRFALQMKDREFSPGCIVERTPEDLRPGDWLQIVVSGYILPEDKIWDFHKCAKVVAEIRSASGKYEKWYGLSVAAFIGNRDLSIWHAGKPEQWGEASVFIPLPPEYDKADLIKVYVWNPDRQGILIDDLRIDWWKK